MKKFVKCIIIYDDNMTLYGFENMMENKGFTLEATLASSNETIFSVDHEANDKKENV